MNRSSLTSTRLPTQNSALAQTWTSHRTHKTRAYLIRLRRHTKLSIRLMQIIRWVRSQGLILFSHKWIYKHNNSNSSSKSWWDRRQDLNWTLLNRLGLTIKNGSGKMPSKTTFVASRIRDQGDIQTQTTSGTLIPTVTSGRGPHNRIVVIKLNT